ncbi:MAG TPA: FecR family protein [Puia sp.]|nr:FecR family protein [Puia sp.]
MDTNQDQTEFSLYIGTLLFKHADHQPLTEQEQKDLLEWRESTPQRQQIFENAMDKAALVIQLRQINHTYDPDEAVKDLFRTLGLTPKAKEKPIARRLIFRLSAAAVVIFLIAGAWFLLKTRSDNDKSTIQKTVTDIPPGGNKATLTLANGRTIVLDSAANGLLAQEQDVQINKTAKGQLSYSPGQTTAAAVYNILTTPKGGEYQLTLPDGTKAWLNAASSIRYPTAFTGNQRRVEIKGEVFFDVAKNTAQPFIATVNGLSVNVLGTKFDVMAYEDENELRTTLVDGKVDIRSNDNVVILAPGQQAIRSNSLATGNTGITARGSTAPLIVKAVDTDKETAWLSGFFQFDQLDLPTILRQFRRWYDIDVEYKANYEGRSFGGRISRRLELSEALALLEYNGVHFKIEGRKLIVLPWEGAPIKK